MIKEERDEIADIVTTAVARAIKNELGQYKVPKEQHYQDHLWIRDVMGWTDTIKNSAVKTIVGIIIAGIFGLLILGFIFWGKGNLH